MDDKFDCQYGIKKVFIEITVNELESIKADDDSNSGTFGDNLANALSELSSYVHWTEFIGERVPMTGVKMVEVK